MRNLKYRVTKRAKSKNRKRHAVNAERVTMPVRAGDTVRVMETRPMSKDKRWRLVEIVTRAK